MKKLYTHETHDTLSTLFFYLAILIFIIGFNFTDSPPPSGWYQQFMPFLNNKPLKDIVFIDSLNGYAITGYTTVDTNYILKTSNGGDNWFVINTVYSQLTRVQFINSNIGFVSGGNIQGGYLIKTLNGGLNWNVVPNSIFASRFEDIFVLNVDTIWLTDSEALVGGLFRTTNGGLNWNVQYSVLGNNPNKIYMYNRNIGFACTNFQLFKTTNSGENWVPISDTSQSNSFREMNFTDTLMGWRTYGDTMKITTNGGFNWSNQTLPNGGTIASNIMTRFAVLGRDTLWGCGGYIHYPNNQYRGILYRTTNSGANWFFQLPDTSINILLYEFINVNFKKHIWGYFNYPTYVTGIHTTTGGDTVWYIGIIQKSMQVPKNFILNQNYPNPFNPRTVIPYSLKSAGYVRIIAYDMLGREVQRLVDRKQSAGEYEVDFMGKFCSSGVYFYRMTVDGNVIGTRKMLMLK